MNNLIDALRALPPGVGDYLETPLEFTEIPYPNSAETGNIASGQAAAMLNNQLLVPFSGYTPIEGFLRIGQYNPVIQGILLASIEYDDSGSTGPTLEDIQAGFREALKRLPPSLSDLLSTPIPEISPVGMPGTEEEAALVTGQVSSNVIKVFVAFSGLMPVALLLRVGMYSNPLHALLFSGLEWSGDKKKILPIEPADEGVYYGSITEWIVDAHSATSVSVTSDDAENYDGGTFDLEPVDGEDNRWSALWAVPIGTHTATITAEYDEDTDPESVEIAFEIKVWATYPEDGDTLTAEEAQGIQPEEIVAYTEEATEDYDSISLIDAASESVFVELLKDQAENVWRGVTWQQNPFETAAGTIDMTFRAVKAMGDETDNVIDKVIQIVIEEVAI